MKISEWVKTKEAEVPLHFLFINEQKPEFISEINRLGHEGKLPEPLQSAFNDVEEQAEEAREDNQPFKEDSYTDPSGLLTLVCSRGRKLYHWDDKMITMFLENPAAHDAVERLTRNE